MVKFFYIVLYEFMRICDLITIIKNYLVVQNKYRCFLKYLLGYVFNFLN